MNTKGIDETHPFVAALLRDKAYRTPHPPRPGFLPALRYYGGVLNVFLHCSWTARHGQFDNQDWFNRSYYTLDLVERIGGSIEITGGEHLANRKGPVVVVSNHMSLLETFLLPCILIPFTPVCFVIKKELTEYPGFGKTMSAINHIAVGRANPRDDFRAVLEKGLAFLQNGISILIFPQSTRNEVFIPSEFNTLGEKLAAKAGVQVIPAAVKTDLHGNGARFKECGRIDTSKPVRIHFGPPADPAADGRAAHDQILAFITGQLRAWDLPVQDPSPPGPRP